MTRESQLNWSKDNWIWAADHNEEQEHNIMGRMMEEFNGQRSQMPGDGQHKGDKNQSTKWANDKCIDHLYTNNRKRTEGQEINNEDKLSDHKALKITLKVEEGFERGTNVMAKTTSYRKLDTMDTEEWQECLKKSWNKQDHTTAIIVLKIKHANR